MAKKSKSVKQEIEANTLASLIVDAVLGRAGDYVPTLSRPEQQAMADAYDHAMQLAGLSKRAWRGCRVVQR